MIQAIIFDLDDTLFPEHQFVLSGFRAVTEWLTLNHSICGFYEQAERLYRDGKRGKIFDLALEKLGVTVEALLIDELIRVFREHRPYIDLYDDARWAIDFFRKSNKLGILTDGYLVTQRKKVDALGIASRFNVVVYSDEAGRENWKPSPMPYKKVMASLGISGDECVYIADNPMKDFVTARQLGWKTIRICREAGEYTSLIAKQGYEADVSIESLFELQGLI
jgi:putative hydrolase of the HAD superfamily